MWSGTAQQAEPLACLAQDSAPKPKDANVKIFSTSEKSAYVKSFSGFATESSILSKAKELSDELKADGIEASTTFFFALYDGELCAMAVLLLQAHALADSS